MSDPGVELPYVGDRERFVVETYDLDHNIADPTSIEFVFKSESGVVEKFKYDTSLPEQVVERRATGVYFMYFIYKEAGIYTWGVELTGNMQKAATTTVNVRALPW